MNTPKIRQAKAAEHKSILNLLTLAFVADPVNRWYLPDADRFLTYFPSVADAFLGASIEAGTCYISKGFEGASVWLPPSVKPDGSALEAVIAEAAPAGLAEPLGKLFQGIYTHHPRDEDCWYLPTIGVDPGH